MSETTEIKEYISFDKDLREAIQETVGILARAVKSTLGPSGTNVGVQSPIKLPISTNDGVTVSKQVSFNDPLKKYICNILKTVSQNTDDKAGDGTTTSITLAEAIITEGLKLVNSGYSQVNVSKGIRAATVEILKRLDEVSTDVISDKDMLFHVASISANNDKELGKLISEAFTKVGVDGLIEVKDSDNETTYVDVVPGMRYPSGFESNMFTTNDRGEAILENCSILIYEGKLKAIQPIIELLQTTRQNNDSLLIIADDFDKVCIDDLAANKLQGALKVCAVKSPGYGEMKEKLLEDIALVTGASIISRRFGTSIEEWKPEMIGIAKDVKADRVSFTIAQKPLDDKAIKARIKSLKAEAKKVSKGDKSEILERIAVLTSGVAVLYVSGSSPMEISEKKYRIEDAVNATRASLEEGIVPGGGVTLLRLGKALKTPDMENESQRLGFNIIKKAMEAPIKTIVTNSGLSGDVVVNEVLRSEEFDYGYDAKLEEYGDMIEAGIIDPVKVTKAALTNASSVSQMLLTMNVAIYG